ncbi:L-gulonolactone oxidase [Parasponia andersonii]|uniref:L-gulonolactone oxidase n=1 Tax=Parasponia andersonii TaxID=3476 RepID=A0A2P5DQD9_PARAD|nr:L-gulonolactone oxidase [Parasponia andersonii]
MSLLGQQVLRLHCLLLLLSVVCCTPPEDPIKCSKGNSNCTITNSYGTFPDRSVCRAGAAAYPATEEELITIVANATRNGLKMKVATRFSHSIPKLVCPGRDDGLLISTKLLNKVLNVDAAAMTMTVGSGVTLRDLISVAANAKLALPYTPYWWGLTIGGLLGTGAHGSTLWGKGSSVHDYVTGLTIVSPGTAADGFVKVRRLKEGDEELNAARVSLGVLGVISQVTFKLEPLFKRSITYVTKNDSDLGDEVLSFGRKNEFADITWYPSQQKAVYRVDNRVASNTSGDGLYDFIPFRTTTSLTLALIRTTEENQESSNDADGKCFGAKFLSGFLSTSAYGLTNNGILFTGYPVNGYQHRLQSSGTCLDSLPDAYITACAWDHNVKGEFFFQTTFSVALSVVKDFIQDVQNLVKLKPKALCGVELYNGILMRYVTASNGYLGKQEDAVDFDITYYRSKDPLTPRLYEDILEEIEQLAVFKYGALPHWGKNRNVAFEGAFAKYKNGQEFLRVKKVYDPLGLFSSEWTDQVLGLKGGLTIVKEGCALEGLCRCTEDIHCAPNKGYFCRPGNIYKDARVCTRLNSTKPLILKTTATDGDEGLPVKGLAVAGKLCCLGYGQGKPPASHLRFGSVGGPVIKRDFQGSAGSNNPKFSSTDTSNPLSAPAPPRPAPHCSPPTLGAASQPASQPEAQHPKPQKSNLLLLSRSLALW